ncbi:hypothetical protein EWM64_g479 [Hericium alpestre]|uniref:Uncharacterized protein n=1 Tax=Hericium alpestre TaxID=135208 RepID=A0A4Z0AB14_9AGAM|nr:hypothetical protein EWM64_g479 [Hericium alpestre]
MKPPSGIWRDRHEPLPFLRYLYDHPRIPAPDPNSHDGYPLSHAVRAGFAPLVRFLLDHGASPRCKDDMAVMLAIQRRDLEMVKLLIEPSTAVTGEDTGRKGKRRRVADRVEVSPRMLRVAVRHKANDIVDYLTNEKGCVPDLQTLRLLC